MCIFFALWDQNLARYSIFMPKNEVKSWILLPFAPPIRILRFSDFARKSSFGIFWGVENFFWKIFFVVKISTTKKFFRKKFSTHQNIQNPDFREITKNRLRDQNLVENLGFYAKIWKSGKSGFRKFWSVGFFFWINFFF